MNKMDTKEIREKFESGFEFSAFVEFSDEYNRYVSSVPGDAEGYMVQIRWAGYLRGSLDMQSEIDELTALKRGG